MSKITYQTPEKIVVIAGPSFGQAFKFILLGAAIGAAAATYLKPKTIVAPSRSRGMAQDLATRFIASKIGFGKAKAAKPDTFRAADLKADASSEATTFGASDYDPAIEDFEVPAKTVEGATSEAGEAIADRIESLTSRLKILGSRAKQLVETASEAVKPTLETALAEGKRVASEVQSNLKKDVDAAGDKPAIAEQDGELPSEKEDKFVE